MRFVLLCLITGPCSDIMQANILITNDTPPRACLADSGSLTMVVDPGGPTPYSTQSGGVEMFMSPELLLPSTPGAQDSTPTMEADIYAFGLVIFQVNELNNGYPRVFLTFFRSLQAIYHSTISGTPSLCSQWLGESALTDQNTLRRLDSPTRCGI